MREKSRASGLVWPAAMTVAGVAILVTLGTWQMQRKAWKEALIGQVAARRAAEPIGLAEALALWRQDPAAAEYVKVRVGGRLEDQIERNYYVGDAKLGPGAQVYSPLRHAPEAVVWVDRGFRPDRIGTGRAAFESLSGNEVQVVGVVRAPGRQGTFTPMNDVRRNQWYWRDLAGMHASAYPVGKVQAAPFFVEVLSVTGGPGGEWPKPGAAPVRLDNRHLEYALTWYGLAATLGAVFGVFAWGRLRARPAS